MSTERYHLIEREKTRSDIFTHGRLYYIRQRICNIQLGRA
jgi:hypothetical protein